ncbi:MAG: undecaprenyl-diphosphate phosphatase [Bdellovibrionales bacterium]|nr:undecaprenyl-diphosphate phosphatase [Bdellovibrionales bacterium]
MEFIELVIMGILQGLTEFLPVSSSGHLTLFQYFSTRFHENLSLNVAVHMGTLLTIIVYYRKDLLEIFKGFFAGDKNSQKMVFHIVVASIPTAIIGLGFKKMAEGILVNPLVASLCLLITGAFLYKAPQSDKSEDWYRKGFGVNSKQAFLIGIVQGLAVLPGISRSGSTIVTALWMGVPAREASRFSFLISVPAIMGAGLLELRGAEGGLQWGDFFLGGMVSFVTGLVAIALMVHLTYRNRLRPFSFYVWTVSIAFLSYYFLFAAN